MTFLTLASALFPEHSACVHADDLDDTHEVSMLQTEMRMNTLIQSSGTWTAGPPMPTVRMGYAGGVNDTHVFVAGGFDGKATLASTLALNVSSGSWSALADLPEARSDLAAGVLKGTLFVAGGMIEQNGAVANTSSVLALKHSGAQWKPVASMPTARRGMALAVDEASSKLYAIGGMNCKTDCYGEDVEYLGIVEVYSVESNSWERLPPMPTPRRELGVAVDKYGRVWAVGGCGFSNSSHDCRATSKVEIYDPESNKWSSYIDLPSPLHGMLIASDGRYVYSVGGASENGVYSAPTPLKTVVRLDMVNGGRWESLPDLPHARYGVAHGGYGFIVEDSLYAIGGSVGSTGRQFGYDVTNLVDVLKLK